MLHFNSNSQNFNLQSTYPETNSSSSSMNSSNNSAGQGRIFVSDEPSVSKSVDEWQSLGHLLIDRLTHKHPNTTIYIDYESGRSWTGSELKKRILNVASALVDQFKFKQGDAVCISYDNSDLSFILSLGVIVAGGIVACAYPKDPYAELLYLARKVEPKFLFCHEKNMSWAKQIQLDLGYQMHAIAMSDLIDGSAGNNEHVGVDFKHFQHLFDYDYNLSNSKDQVPRVSRDLSRQVALITMSSGTTGKPKAVPVTHWNCIADLISYRRTSGPQIHMACCASLDYVSGRIIAFGAIQSGYTAVILNGFEPESYLSAIERYRIHIAYLGAASFYNLITYKHIDQYDLSSLRVVFPMGAKIIYLDELREFFRKHPNIVQVKQGFGSSETSGGAMNSFTPEEYLKDCDNCGKLLPGQSAKIVDIKTGQLLGINQQGILHLRGETVFPGYYDIEQMRVNAKLDNMKLNGSLSDKNANEIDDSGCSPFVVDSSVFDQDGFYITGDIAYFNQREELYFVGRHKELMSCRGAKKVLPQELEEIIDEHPAVFKVTVLGIPHKTKLTQHCPRAFVVPVERIYDNKNEETGLDLLRTQRLTKLADSDETHEEEKLVHTGPEEHKLCRLPTNIRRQLAEDLMEFVNDRVGWEKQLTGGVIILDEIPTSRATGKVDKNYLRSLTSDRVEIYGDRTTSS